MPKDNLENFNFPARRPTRGVSIGAVVIGAGAPVSIQSMLTVPLTALDSAVEQARALAMAGCEIIRVAVPDKRSIPFLAEFRKAVPTPIVADIHFDFRLAIASAEAGVDKLRINPGNIGSQDKIKAVAEAAIAHKIPIRIGVNAGSLPDDLIMHPYRPSAMALAAMREAEILEDFGLNALVVSIKSHDVPTTILANRIFASQSNIPLHLGITEAGTPLAGSIRNAVGIGILLLDGIGDTIRVSLSGDPLEEVLSAKHILRSCNLYSKGINLIACPTCGRTRIAVAELAKEVEMKLADCDLPLTVAIMGCEVNGPGEAREADIGFAGTKGGFVVFEKGELKGKVSGARVDQILDEIKRFIEEQK